MHYRIASGALSATVSDGVVLVNMRSKRYFSLNETGTRVWELLVRDTSAEEIVATLLREYDVDESEVRRTVNELLAALAAEWFIEAVS